MCNLQEEKQVIQPDIQLYKRKKRIRNGGGGGGLRGCSD